MAKQTDDIQKAQNAIGVKVEIGSDVLALERETEELLAELMGVQGTRGKQ